MTVNDIIKSCSLGVLNLADGDREIKSVYCCDLLSVVMSKAQADCAWVTIMGNMNTTAVAQLTDMAVVVLAKDTALDDITVEKAKMQDINLLRSDKPIFETALDIHKSMNNA